MRTWVEETEGMTVRHWEALAGMDGWVGARGWMGRLCGCDS